MAPLRPRIFSPRSWPLTAKAAADLLVAAIVPLAIGVWVASARGMEALSGEARTNLELLASVTATQLDQLMADTTAFVEQVAGDERVIEFCGGDYATRDRLRDAVQRRLSLVPRANDDFESIFLIGTDGFGIASTNYNNVGQDLRFREYWHRAAKGEAFRTSVLVGKTTNRPGIYYSVPIRRDEAIVGVAVLKVSGKRVAEIVDGVRFGVNGRAVVSDRNGVVLAAPDKAVLYHSFGPLDEASQTRIDPMLSFSVKSIESLGIPELMAPLTSASGRGAVRYTRARSSGDDTREPWIVGFAPMATQPWIVSVTLPEAEFAAPLLALRQQQVLIVIVVAVLAAAYAVARARGITSPIRSLTQAAQRIAEGDLSAQADVRSSDEIGQLGAAFNAMIPKLREQIDLRQSLAVAMDVQQALLPASDPTPEGLEVAGRSRYCDETGGDYYDYIDVTEISPGSTLVVIGDVMGHGIASALLMATARAALRAAAASGASLSSLLSTVNRVLAADARHGRFMTMLVALIEVRAKRVRWASAAHDPIIRYDPASDSFDELEGSDLPLGVMKNTQFEEFTRNGLDSGQLLLIGTDGIWETRNEAGEFYGKERLQELMRANSQRPVNAIADALDEELASFRGNAKILDDITYVVVRVKA